MKPRVIIIGAVVAGLLVITIYVSQFGGPFSSNHSHWGEFGSYFGGVLGAIFGFSSLLYLAVQVRYQSEENRKVWLRSDINHREQYIANCLMILLPKLKESDPALGAPLAHLLLRIHDDIESKKNKEFVELLRAGLSARSQTVALWMNISAALSYLKTVDEYRYLDQLNLIAVQVGGRLCAALDETINLVTGKCHERHFDR